MSDQLKMPGGQLASRPLHFFWVCDVSSSMRGRGKIEQLNYAIRESLPLMKNIGAQSPNAQIFVRTITFGTGAKWVNPSMIPIEEYQWTDLSADGVTDMGAALKMVAEELKVPPMPKRALPPVVILISDGHPTDDFDHGLNAFMNETWGMKAVRIGISIGADADQEVLRRFIGSGGYPLLNANNAHQLVEYIKWASTEVLQFVSRETIAPHPAADPERVSDSLSSKPADFQTSVPPQTPSPQNPSQNYNDLVW